MSIKKAILCAGITIVLVYMAVGLIVMWNSVDYDQYEEDEDEELSTDKLSFEELKEKCLSAVIRIRSILQKQKKQKYPILIGQIH